MYNNKICRKKIQRTIVLLALLILAAPASAMVSICSGEFLSERGVYGVRHEARWSYYDNWFHNLFVEVESEAGGTLAASRRDTYPMSEGGSVVHYLPEVVEGEHRVDGRIQLGYPRDWGFDGYQILECPSWIGLLQEELTNESEQALNDIDTAGPAFGTSVGALSIDSCSLDDESEACQSALSGGEEMVGSDQRDATDKRGAAQALFSGLIQAVDREGLVLQTLHGAYVTIYLDRNPALTRRTEFSLRDARFKAGDQIGMVRIAGLDEIRVYRDQLWSVESKAPRPWSDTDTGGLEQRAVLQSVELNSDAKSGQLRLTRQEQGVRSYRATEDTVVALIEPATFEDLKAFAGAVRVSASQQADGRLMATRIEILR